MFSDWRFYGKRYGGVHHSTIIKTMVAKKYIDMSLVF